MGKDKSGVFCPFFKGLLEVLDYSCELSQNLRQFSYGEQRSLKKLPEL